jgi:hypothetical protein
MGRRATETTTEQGEKTVAVIEYVAPGGVKGKKVFAYVPTSENVSTYSVISFIDPDTREQQTSDVMTSSKSETTSILAQVNPQICTGFLEAGIGVNGGLQSSQITIRTITYVIGRDGPRASRDEERQFLSEIAFAGGIGIPAQAYVVNDEPVNLTNGLIHTGTLINDYYIDEAAGTTKTVTSRYIAQGLTTEGKSSFAKRAAEADTVDEVLAAIRDASYLVFDGISVRSSVGRDYGVESRSSDQRNTADNLGSGTRSEDVRFDGYTGGDAGFGEYDPGPPLEFPPEDPFPGDFWTDLNNEPYIWDGDSWIPFTFEPPTLPNDFYIDPSTGIEYEWDGSDWIPTDNEFGSTPDSGIDFDFDDRVIDDVITLPFPNDDVLITIPDEEGGLDDWLAPGGADLQAIALAELEQALRYGHAYGANITLEAWVLPTVPLEPYTVRAGGLEVQYLADGCSWEWDANALVVSCDGLYIGVTGKVAGEDVVPWVPGVPNSAGLPVVSTPTVNSGARPANTIPTPIGFQASRPGGMWNLLPTNGVDEYEETSEPSHVIAPYSVRERSEILTRSLVVETEVPYSLNPVTETIVAVSRSTATISSGVISIAASPGTVTVVGQDVELISQSLITLAADAGSVAVDGNDADLRVPLIALGAESGAVVVAGQDAELGVPEPITLVADAGSVAVAGIDADLRVPLIVLGADAGAVVVTGVDASLRFPLITMAAAAGEVTVTGQDATLGTVTPPATDDDGFGLLGLLTLTEGLTSLDGET